MATKLLSIKEIVEPITGGYWGETVETGLGNARVVRNSDVLESGEIEGKAPERKLSEKEIAKAQLRTGDLLMTMSGNVGRVARVRDENDTNGKPYVASNFVKILRTKENVLPEYLFFFLRGAQFQNELKKHTRGVAIQNLSVKLFEQKLIPDLPLEEQRHIIEMLEEAEELRQKRVDANEKTTDLIPALFMQIFGTPSDWESKWQTVSFGDVSSFVTSGSRGWAAYYAETGARFIRVQNLAGHQLSFDNIAFVNPPQTVEAKRTLVQPNDLLLAITGNTIGLSAFAPRNVGEAYVSQHVAIIRPNENVNPIYLSTFTALKDGVQQQINRGQYGQTKPALTLTQVRALKLPLPPIKLQNDFAEKVKEILALENKQKESAKQIDGLFSSLLSRSFIASN